MYKAAKMAPQNQSRLFFLMERAGGGGKRPSVQERKVDGWCPSLKSIQKNLTNTD